VYEVREEGEGWVEGAMGGGVMWGRQGQGREQAGRARRDEVASASASFYVSLGKSPPC